MSISYPREIYEDGGARARRLHGALGLAQARPGDSRGQQNQVKGNGHPSDVPKLLLARQLVYTPARQAPRLL